MRVPQWGQAKRIDMAGSCDWDCAVRASQKGDRLDPHRCCTRSDLERKGHLGKSMAADWHTRPFAKAHTGPKLKEYLSRTEPSDQGKSPDAGKLAVNGRLRRGAIPSRAGGMASRGTTAIPCGPAISHGFTEVTLGFPPVANARRSMAPTMTRFLPEDQCQKHTRKMP